jgi:hypothetical protein
MLKIYARFMILLNSSHMYVLNFKTCPSMTYICLLLALRKNPLIINFLCSFQIFQNCQGSLNRICLGLGFSISFLKAMAGKGHERPSKQCQEISGSSSS